MNLDQVLKKLMTEKKDLTKSLELCCDSIGFWEERADKIFKRMDRSKLDSIIPGIHKLLKKELEFIIFKSLQ